MNLATNNPVCAPQPHLPPQSELPANPAAPSQPRPAPISEPPSSAQGPTHSMLFTSRHGSSCPPASHPSSWFRVAVAPCDRRP